MEVSGKRVVMSEDDLICLPCNLDGITEPAHGYCLDCQEHLCESCFKHHKRSRPSRNHVLLTKEAMSKDQSVSIVKSSDETDFCPSHTDKRLEFYCGAHGSIGCYVCATLGHKTCEVGYIPDISGNVSESSEFCNLMTQLRTMKQKCAYNLNQARALKEKIELDLVKVIEEIMRFRKEINDCLDKLEAEIIKDVELLVHAEKRNLTNMSETYKELVKDVGECENILNKLNEDNKQNNLFVEMKRTEEQLFVFKHKENQTQENNSTHSGIDFVLNQKVIDGLKTQTFGRLVLRDTDKLEAQEEAESYPKISTYPILPDKDKAVNIHVSGTIDVKSPTDKDNCNIQGILLIPPSKIIIADCNNNSIKVIDRKRNTVISETKLSSRPTDIISLKHDKLAVALLSKKCIQVLSLSLSPDRRINVGEKCYGLAYGEDKLVVCNYDPGKMIIMNLAGSVLTAFDSKKFDSPEKVVVSKDKKNIYVTDCSFFSVSHRMLKVDWQGNIISTFEDSRYKRPKGIQELDDGTFLVCFSDSGTIVRLSSDCKECEITGLKKTDICYPTSMAYCEEERKLYVSCASGISRNANTIKVLDVKWV